MNRRKYRKEWMTTNIQYLMVRQREITLAEERLKFEKALISHKKICEVVEDCFDVKRKKITQIA